MFAQLNKLQKEQEEGFTLIELLVVVLIIGILSAIAVPTFINQRKSAIDASVQADISSTVKQVETFISKSGARAKPLSATGVGIKDIKVSSGNQITITGNTFHYTIEGWNDDGDVSGKNVGYVYNSKTGGLVKNATSVPYPDLNGTTNARIQLKSGGTVTTLE